VIGIVLIGTGSLGLAHASAEGGEWDAHVRDRPPGDPHRVHR
jgi:hypothetical protein